MTWRDAHLRLMATLPVRDVPAKPWRAPAPKGSGGKRKRSDNEVNGQAHCQPRARKRGPMRRAK